MFNQLLHLGGKFGMPLVTIMTIVKPSKGFSLNKFLELQFEVYNYIDLF
jgi:hypothetical protein